MSRLSARQAALIAATAPTWQHSFLGGVLPSGDPFTRGSAGWSWNGAGVLVQSAANVARFDYDPVSFQPLGYLAEMQSTNSCANSTNLVGTGWAGNNIGTPATDGTLGPDGATQMYKITASAGTTQHDCQYTSGFSVTSGQAYAVSAAVKQGNQRYVSVGDSGASSWHNVTYDFQTNTFTGQTNATGQARQLANGLYRIACLVASASSTHNARVNIGFGSNSNASSGMSFTAVGTETGYATDVQIDSVGVGVTSIIKTAGSTVTRSADILSLPITSLPGWNASRGGVLVAAYRLHTLVPASPGYNQVPVEIDDGSVSNALIVLANQGGGGNRRAVMLSGGSEYDGNGSISSPAAFIRTKQATGWSATRIQQANDGGNLVTATIAGALPVSPTTLHIGTNDATNRALQGTLESIAYYAGARSDAFVQAVSR